MVIWPVAEFGDRIESQACSARHMEGDAFSTDEVRSAVVRVGVEVVIVWVTLVVSRHVHVVHCRRRWGASHVILLARPWQSCA